MFGKNILTKSEQKHLKEMGVTILYLFEETRKQQKELERLHPNTTACYTCRTIERKLKE